MLYMSLFQGKIEVRGPDSAALLNYVLSNEAPPVSFLVSSSPKILTFQRVYIFRFVK